VRLLNLKIIQSTFSTPTIVSSHLSPLAMEGATITSIPRELRRKIYSYLLLDQNVVEFTLMHCLRPSYTTALFTVNKQLSDESLHYFFTENAFVGVEMNNVRFFDNFQRGIPILINQIPNQRAPRIVR
jgi:hypothetical protein